VRISFGPFAFDRQSRLLWREGIEVALPPRVLGVLELLIDRPGQVVARQELMDAVWKDAFVTDTSLAEAVSFLRQALGDDPQAPRHIQTVHRRGYRFLAPLTEAPPPRGLTPDPGVGSIDRGLTPQSDFAVSSGARPVSATAAPLKTWQFLPWSVAIFCTGIGVAAAWHALRQPEPDAPPIARFEIRAADGTSFASLDPRVPTLTVSADGRIVTWSACETASGACALYVRPIEALDAARLPGTDGAAAPFFSPDGRWIGFFADGKVKKIAASGGAPFVLTDAPSPAGGAWGANGQIVFAGAPAGGLSSVSDQGGAPTILTTPDTGRGELRHLLPSWLSDGTAIVFTIASSPLPDAPGELAVVPIRGGATKILRGGVTRAAAAAPGYLLLASGNDLQAATFDERTLTLTSSGASVLASITGRGGLSQFAVSRGGTLVALDAPPAGRVVWTDRPDSDAGSIGRLASMAVSPDSRRAAGVIADSSGSDVWIADVASGALTRVTFGGTNVSPAWSADGQRLFFATRTSGAFSLASRPVDDRADAQSPRNGPAGVFPSSAGSDGTLAVTTVSPASAPVDSIPTAAGHTAVAVISPNGGAPKPLTDGPFDEAHGVFSPDARWLALESNESGRSEIVVRDLRDGHRFPVSADGGSKPRWSADGRAIYFESGRRLMRASFDPGREPHSAHPDVVLDRDDARVLAVTPSGRVLIRQQPRTASAIVILQWLRELRQRVPLPVTAPR